MAAANYRYWCGECYYRTPWLSEAESAEQQVEHYTAQHPGIPADGRVEVRADTKDGGGCLAFLGLLFLLLLLASTCLNHWSVGSMPSHMEVSYTADYCAINV